MTSCNCAKLWSPDAIMHFNKTNLIGIVLGISFVCSFATLQFIFVYGIIEAKNYIIPTILGSIVGYVLSLVYDHLAKAKHALLEQNQQLQLVLDSTNTGIWDWNPQTNAIKFNDHWLRLIGYAHDELPHELATWESRVPEDDLKQAYAAVQDHLDGKTAMYSHVHRMKHKQGHWVHILAQGRITARDQQGKPTRFMGTHVDVTHLKEVENELAEKNEKLQALTLIDGLTGLKNRRALDDYLPRQWSHWQREKVPFCVLMLDIDFFKDYNDFYGHVAGDACLQKVAHIIKNHVHRANDIAVRYGGEEFLVAYSGVDQNNGLKIAEQVRQEVVNLAIPHENSNVAEVVTLSIGVFACDQIQPCSSMLQPIDNADQALYLAKQRGRNQVSTL